MTITDEILNKWGITREQYNYIIASLYHAIVLNDLCIGQFYEIHEMLRKSPYYRQEVKRWAKLTERHVRKYNATLATVISNVDYVADLNEFFSEEVERDVQLLELTTVNFMEKHRMRETRLQAKVSMVHILADGACRSIDMSIRNSPGVAKYMGMVKRLKIEIICEAAKKMEAELDRLLRGECDLNDSEDIYNGYKIILKKINDPQVIMRVLDRADKLHRQ